MSSGSQRIGKVLLLFLASALNVVPLARTDGQVQASAIAQNAPLSVGEVVKKLEEMNRERNVALQAYQGTRTYRMQYRGFPSSRDAEMVVDFSYQSPGTKHFTVVSQTGSKFIIDHVFKKLMDGEQEAADEDNQRRATLNSDNYDFKLAGFDDSPGHERYILEVCPKNKSKFLYRGKIWIDAKDFAVTRIEAEPAKNPSFWIKQSEIHHEYIKVGSFWLPKENRTESWVKLGGNAVLSIEYKDYTITEAKPINAKASADETTALLPR